LTTRQRWRLPSREGPLVPYWPFPLLPSVMAKSCIKVSLQLGAAFHQAFIKQAAVTQRTMKDAKPTDLPLRLRTKCEFVINLKTAKPLGLAIPSGLISFAVIE
jgi:ABC-type uncharacterized transport system substrate-binding protein